MNTIAAVRRETPTGLLAIVAAALLAAALLSACGSDSGSGAAQYSDRTDSPLLEFGKEGSEAEFEEATEATHTFFVDRASGDFEGACAQLGKSILGRIEHLAVKSTGLADTSCASFLESFLRLSAQERRDSTTVDGGGLRREGSSGYLIYGGVDDTVYAMPLEEEGGQWKLGSLSSKQLN